MDFDVGARSLENFHGLRDDLLPDAVAGKDCNLLSHVQRVSSDERFAIRDLDLQWLSRPILPLDTDRLGRRRKVRIRHKSSHFLRCISNCMCASLPSCFHVQSSL